MFSSLQLPFLQALGYAIANSLWQLFLLWLIVVFVNSIAKQSAHVRYVTALSAQFAGFVWFVSTFQFYYRHCQEASLQAEQLLAKHDVLYSTSMAMNDSVLNYLIKAEAMLPYLSIAYLFLLLLLVVKWINNFRYTKQLATTGLQPANLSWQRFVNEMADQLGILQNITLHLSSFAKSPLTIGYIKPIILLPLASVNQLTTQQMEAVLLHELAHIKRADYLINILVSVVEIILFFNPFTRLLSETIKKERENCCDDWVLQYQYDAAMYAEALLRLAYLQKLNGFQMSAVGSKKSELLQRIKRMVQPTEKTFNYKHQIIALFLITGVLFSIAWLQPIEKNINQKQTSNVKEINKKIIITPLTAQVDNPLFNAATLFAPSLREDVKQSLDDMNKTFNDSAVKTNLMQAEQALQKVVPEVISTASSANLQKIMQDAKQQASKSLQSIDWKNIAETIPQMVDSSLIQQSVNDALQNKTDYADNVKQGLAAAKEQLARLKSEKLNVYFDKEFLQQLTSTAFASLKNINFKAIEDSIKLSSDVVNKAFLQLELKQEEIKKRQRTELKKVLDNYKKAEDALKRIVPVAPPLPLMPTQYETHYNADAASVVNVLSNDNTACLAVPAYHFETDHNNDGLKTIHIINKSDGSTINIVIEIRQ